MQRVGWAEPIGDNGPAGFFKLNRVPANTPATPGRVDLGKSLAAIGEGRRWT